GNILTLGNGTGSDTTVDLSGYLDNTDSQTLSITDGQLGIPGGNTVALPTADGTETKVTAGANVSVSGEGSISRPYIVGVASVNDADAIVGNEVTGATNGTLTRSGSGTTGSPYTLHVATGGITANELDDNAVTSDKIVDGTIAT